MLKRTFAAFSCAAFIIALAFSGALGASAANGLPPTFSEVTIIGPRVMTVGNKADVYFQGPHDQNDLTAGACTVNGANVAPSFRSATDGLYRLDYIVFDGHTERAAGTIPVDCTVTNSEGLSLRVTSFIANNIAVDTNLDGVIATSTGNGSGNGTTTDNGSGNATTTDNGSGNATSTGNGVLAVTSVDQTDGEAVADGTFQNGWVWTFNVTVPSDEDSLKVKFGDWTSGTSTIPTAGNVRVSSAQASSTGAITLTGTDYSQAMAITGDLSTSTPGFQIQIKVEAKVPAGTANGSYAASYGLKSE